jgi:hypothetical protein
VGIYAGLYLALGGEVMLPFGVGWSVFLIWACAHVGGYVATQALPSLRALRVCLPQSRAPPHRVTQVSVAYPCEKVYGQQGARRASVLPLD